MKGSWGLIISNRARTLVKWGLIDRLCLRTFCANGNAVYGIRFPSVQGITIVNNIKRMI